MIELSGRILRDCSMGFLEKIVGLIMKCVTTVSFSLLLNARRMGSFTPRTWHLTRQPAISLFILCVEGLSCLLSKAVDEGQISGFKLQ